MKQGIFIQTNGKQMLGAILAKFALERTLSKSVPITIINVEEQPAFKKLAHKTFLRYGSKRVYDPEDLQSFTLTRFMPPQLMGYEGRALVIDPDIFALADIVPLLETDLKGHAIAACSNGPRFDTSVMVLDCSKLRHWDIESVIEKLVVLELDYGDLFSLKGESVLEIPRIWNSCDVLTSETKMLHTTNRLTQPWKTGLPIDFTRNKMPKMFGIIPREPIYKFLGKYPTHYLPHPDKKIEAFFLKLAQDAYRHGVISKSDILREMRSDHIRHDMLGLLEERSYERGSATTH